MNRRLAIFVALAVIVASLAYPLGAWLLGRAVVGYSPLTQQISELGVSSLPHAWVLTALLVVDAVLVVALAFAVRRSIGSPSEHPWAVRLLALYGVVLLIGGLFPCDAQCRPTTWRGLIHVLNALPSIVAAIGAPLWMSRKLAEDPRLSILASLSFCLGVLTAVAIVAAFTVFPWLQLPGLGQRVVLTFQLSFFVLTSFAVIDAQRYIIGGHAQRIA